MATVGRLAVSRLLFSRPGIAPRALKTSTRTSASTTHQPWQQHGVPGSTLPFKLGNHYKLTLYFTLYCVSGFNLPFLVVIHQYVKKGGCD